MIILTIVLGVVAHLLFWVVIPMIEKSNRLKGRYFERNIKYDALLDGSLAERQAAAKNEPPPLREFAEFQSDIATKYASPILFPFDLIMMSFMAAFLAVGSVTFAANVPRVADWTCWFMALPILYFLVDLAEDTILAWLLTNPAAVTPERVGFLKFLTVSKIVSLVAAYVQCGALFLLAVGAWLRST